jgi:hypothetical protein
MSAQMPKGVEVLLRKAAVDPTFKAILLEQRAAAAREIGLELNAAEAAMLSVVPAAQLEAIIARTSVPEEHRRTFLGKAAAAMLAIATASAAGCAACHRALGTTSLGNRPDWLPQDVRSKPSKTQKKAPPDNPGDER